MRRAHSLTSSSKLSLTPFPSLHCHVLGSPGLSIGLVSHLPLLSFSSCCLFSEGWDEGLGAPELGQGEDGSVGLHIVLLVDRLNYSSHKRGWKGNSWDFVTLKEPVVSSFQAGQKELGWSPQGPHHPFCRPLSPHSAAPSPTSTHCSPVASLVPQGT